MLFSLTLLLVHLLLPLSFHDGCSHLAVDLCSGHLVMFSAARCTVLCNRYPWLVVADPDMARHVRSLWMFFRPSCAMPNHRSGACGWWCLSVTLPTLFCK
jgi:hypothetical protein